MAQRQRNPGGGGSARAVQGGRPMGAQDRGGRSGPGRGYDQPRPSSAPQNRGVQLAAPSSSSGNRYAVQRAQPYQGQRGQAYPGGRYVQPVPGNPAVAGPSRAVPRGYVAPGAGLASREYVGRPVDPGYGRPAYGKPGYAPRPGYGVRPGYAVPRGYVAPRGYAPYKPYGYGYGYGYRHGHYYGPPRYVAPGWRGPYGYAVLTPRYIYPSVISIGYWQPYYYRPSIGIGVYYGADGLYPFGAVQQAYYDPSPGVVYGGLRITDAPRDAQVFADGNYVGIVDDFDGASQHLNLEAGRHRIEIHAPGLTPIAFDVDVIGGQTIELEARIQ
jgi:hypothetical protein